MRSAKNFIRRGPDLFNRLFGRNLNTPALSAFAALELLKGRILFKKVIVDFFRILSERRASFFRGNVLAVTRGPHESRLFEIGFCPMSPVIKGALFAAGQ